MIARGPHLAAMRANGLTLESGGTSRTVKLRCTDDPAELGPQDFVVLTLKAHSVRPALAAIRKLLSPATAIVTAQNGILWWYFHALPGPWENHHLETADPGGEIWNALGPERAIGCVVYPASELLAPGVVHHIEGDRFPVGELDGSTTERVQRISSCFANAGFKSPVLDNIRAEIWLKLWGNLTFNPISALSHSTLVDICQYPLSRELAAGMMREAQTVAGKLGIEFRVPLEKRIAGAEKVGKHKTSMLQDVEAGRAPEIDALVGSVAELVRLTETPTPHIDTVYALVKLLARGMEEARGGVRLQAAH